MSVIWKSMVQWAGPSFHRRIFFARDKAADAIAIAVEKTADHKSGNFVLFILSAGDGGALPERPIALLVQIEKEPGRGIETSRQRFFVSGEIRGGREPDLHVHAEFEFIDVHEAINVMNIVVKKIFGGAHCDDCFQRRR